MPRPKKGHRSLGKSKQVTYRMPLELYDKLMKIADSMFQPIPVVLRAAAAEYARNHRPIRHKNTGLTLEWPDAQDTIERDKRDEWGTATEADAGIKDTVSDGEYVTVADTPVTPRKEDT